MANTTVNPNTAFGADWNPLSPEELTNPYPFYDLARAEAPVFYGPKLP